MSDCLFCKIVSKTIPADIVYEDEFFLAFNDISPQAPKHILVIPKIHIANHLDLSEEYMQLLTQLPMVINKIASEQGLSEKGFRIVNNVKSDGGQEIDHIHWHILGGRQLQWPPG